MTVTTREWELAARPHGEPTPEDFRLVEREHPDPGEGQVVVRMLVMSVDPYMRGRMRAGKSYAAAWEVGETMQGGAVGRVVDSRSPDVPVGALVLADAGRAGSRPCPCRPVNGSWRPVRTASPPPTISAWWNWSGRIRRTGRWSSRCS